MALCVMLCRPSTDLRRRPAQFHAATEGILPERVLSLRMQCGSSLEFRLLSLRLGRLDAVEKEQIRVVVPVQEFQVELDLLFPTQDQPQVSDVLPPRAFLSSPASRAKRAKRPRPK